MAAGGVKGRQESLIFIGLGSNLGDRRGNILTALRLLDRPRIRVARVSSLYQTEPVGFGPQPDYYNAVCILETDRPPRRLLAACLDVEAAMGRARGVRWGPRLIDLDLLFYSQRIVQTPSLTVPHPRLAERRFVLEPLCEIPPEFRDPMSGKTVRDLLRDCPDLSRVRRLED